MFLRITPCHMSEDITLHSRSCDYIKFNINFRFVRDVRVLIELFRLKERDETLVKFRSSLFILAGHGSQAV